MSSLADSEKQLLLEVARRALVLAVERRESFVDFPAHQALQHPGGAFVTLRRRRELRGCIGQFASRDSLVQVVAYCAKAAALEDPRFSPVPPVELVDIEIEISVLSPPAEISADRIEVGTHGLVISRGWQRGVLLPQVASELRLTAARFLEETCVKAGLERGAWMDPATRIQAFTAEVFSESDFRTESQTRPGPGYSTST
jgi:AmmeMemoRadiSam system protein A